MNLYNAFVEVFGNMTVLDAAVVVGALVFLFGIYKKISDYLIKRHDAEQEERAQLKECLDSVHRYPEYRQQSLTVQQKLEDQIKILGNTQDGIMTRLDKLESDIRRRECNRTRDRLLQLYRHYTDLQKNPGQCWNSMESEAFWAMFSDYESDGGDGFMHTVVQPVMQKLKVVDLD